jgi:hypothetical protein
MAIFKSLSFGLFGESTDTLHPGGRPVAQPVFPGVGKLFIYHHENAKVPVRPIVHPPVTFQKIRNPGSVR